MPPTQVLPLVNPLFRSVSALITHDRKRRISALSIFPSSDVDSSRAGVRRRDNKLDEWLRRSATEKDMFDWLAEEARVDKTVSLDSSRGFRGLVTTRDVQRGEVRPG